MTLPRNESSGFSTVGSVAARVAYPVALLGALGLWQLGAHLGLSERAATLLGVVPIGLALMIAERVAPYTKAWHAPAKAWGIDALHNLVTALGIAPLVRAVILVLVVDASVRLTEALGVGLWPSELPLALQLPLALFISDFGAYWAHRLMHLTRVGWRVHVVHHCAERLDVMASARTHPFNAILTLTCETAPLLLLGIGPEAIAAWTVFKAVNGLLQHSNVAMRPGLLSYVVATSDVHRYHHSVHLEESNTNFGNTTMIWDHVFGTFHLPRGARAGERVGVSDAAIPESYLAHLAAPFALARYERAAMSTADGDHG